MATTAVMQQRPAWDVGGVANALERAVTESGELLVSLIEDAPILLVFLRHSGCTFCREAVADIAKAREQIEASGTRIVLVHMGDRLGIETLTIRHGLADVDRICDDSRALYQAFGLTHATWRQLYGLKVWARGIWAGLLRCHGVGRPTADYTQMPGVFFVQRGLIAGSYRHRSAADRPSYTSLCSSANCSQAGRDQEDY